MLTGIWTLLSRLPSPGLRKLDLSVGNMTDAHMFLPPCFTCLTNLTELSLTRGQPKSHVDVDLAFDTLNVAHAISCLTDLVHLRLEGMIDSVPAQFSKLVRLTGLELERFGKKWPLLVLPAALQQCSNLQTISLAGTISDMTYEGWPSICQSLRALPRLRTLELSELDFQIVPSSSWVFNTQLTRLSLFDCELQAMPEAITSLTSLRSLLLAHNEIEALLLGPYLQRLTRLDIAWMGLQFLPQVLRDAPCLQCFSLGEDITEESWFDWQELQILLPAGCHMQVTRGFRTSNSHFKACTANLAAQLSGAGSDVVVQPVRELGR